MKTSGFLSGALLGLIAGLLVAPRSGKETREKIKKNYEEISDRISEELSRLKGITKETYAQVVGTVVHGFVEAKKITSEEAAELKGELKKGSRISGCRIRRRWEPERPRPEPSAGTGFPHDHVRKTDHQYRQQEETMGEMIDKSKGKIKQAVGDLTGNKKLKREGERDELKGRA